MINSQSSFFISSLKCSFKVSMLDLEANSGCGWCASSTSCMSIASDGTVEGTCSDFQGSQCVGEPCSYYTTCNSCARVPFCMFNNANGRCEFLPASGEQPAAQYTAYGASCGQ